ncbi:MAG: substrate-binding domain-containing protein [Fimbriimonas sp.]
MKNHLKHLGMLALAGLTVLASIGCGDKPAAEGSAGTSDGGGTKKEGKLTMGIMPKLVGIPYFAPWERGAKEAGKELGIEIVYDGPVTADTAKQVSIVESWIAKKYDAIIAVPNDPDGIAPALQKAASRGIKVLTADADANPEDREFFVSQATDAAVAKALVDSMAKGIGPNGKFIILTGSLTAANQNRWMAEMEKYRKEKYPNMVNLSPTPKTSEEDQALATQVTIDILKTYPDVQGIYAITSVALPGAAEALRKEKAAGRIFLTGLATPNAMKEYVKDGTVKEFTLWDPADLGYLSVQAAKGTLDGTLTKDSKEFKAGRLGTVKVDNGIVLLGDPVLFNKDNIDKYDF